MYSSTQGNGEEVRTEPIEDRGTIGVQPEIYFSSSRLNGNTVHGPATIGTPTEDFPSSRAENVETPQHGDAGDRGATAALPESYPSLVEKYTSCRWRLGYLMVAAFILVQTMLNSMSFALVCMTTAPAGTHNQSLIDAYSSALYQNTTDGYGSMTAMNTTIGYAQGNDLSLKPEFEYSSETQGLLISSVYYAGVISPIFGSFASRAVGAKRVILTGMVAGGVMMMLIPIAARTHVYLVVLCRVILGLGVNVIAAVSMDFWLYWAPALEKAQLVAYSFTGYNVANIITFATSGLLCLIPVDNGWPFIFYLFGGLTLLWCCVCQWMVYACPEVHPTISEAEKLFILQTRSKVKRATKRRAIPWKDIFQTRGVWAYFLTTFCHSFNASLLFSYIPSYMATALNFPIEQNGFLSSLPYITRVISNLLVSWLSLKLLNVLSVTHTRKLVQCTGFLLGAVVTSLLCVLQEGQSHEAVAILSSATPFQAATVNAAMITPLDMAPQFAAMITSVGTVFGHGGNMLSPLVASFILTERTRGQWNIVFLLLSGVYVFSALLFFVLGSGELQPWADDVKMDIDIRENNETKKTSHVNKAYIADEDETTHI